MTPGTKNQLKLTAQSRFMPLLGADRGRQEIESKCYVDGYAARYEPYLLYEDEDGPVYEQFLPEAFRGCDMSDVILQYDHAGKVMARTGNGSLLVRPDETGLFFAADLDRTDAARTLWSEIRAGMITQMSWRFLPGEYGYDAARRTIVHQSVRKIYDVSAVSIPANPNTEINARAWVDGVIGQAARSEAIVQDRRRKLRLKLRLQEEISYEN